MTEYECGCASTKTAIDSPFSSVTPTYHAQVSCTAVLLTVAGQMLGLAGLSANVLAGTLHVVLPTHSFETTATSAGQVMARPTAMREGLTLGRLARSPVAGARRSEVTADAAGRPDRGKVHRCKAFAGRARKQALARHRICRLEAHRRAVDDRRLWAWRRRGRGMRRGWRGWRRLGSVGERDRGVELRVNEGRPAQLVVTDQNAVGHSSGVSQGVRTTTRAEGASLLGHLHAALAPVRRVEGLVGDGNLQPRLVEWVRSELRHGIRAQLRRLQVAWPG